VGPKKKEEGTCKELWGWNCQKKNKHHRPSMKTCIHHTSVSLFVALCAHQRLQTFSLFTTALLFVMLSEFFLSTPPFRYW